MESHASGLRSLKEHVYQADDALDELFQVILEVLADTDVFGHSTSPSVFIVYAHDNDKEGIANAWCVRSLIKWLGVIRSRTLSDKSPLPLWSTRENGSDAVRNILDNQFCLLPARSSSDDTSSIHSVDKVVLYGSEVLKRYYENDFTSSYIDAIETLYAKGQTESTDLLVLQGKIRKLAETRSHHDAFHHVLTELAFLKLRTIHSHNNHGIVSVALDEDLMTYLPFRNNCDLVLKLKSPTKVDLHQLFFKLLGQIYVEEHILINNFQGCYDQARKRLQHEDAITRTRSQQIVNQEILKAQNALKGLGSASFRILRREKEREYQNDSSEHHRYANQDSRAMYTNFKRLLDDTRAIKTKLEPNKLEEVLEWLSICPFRLHHKSVSNALMPGSGAWLTRHSVYRDWLQSSSPSILLVHGVRGCGKSSIFSVAVDQLLVNSQSNARTQPCAYYYCADSPSEPDRAAPDAILRSILRQLAIDQNKATIEPKIWSAYERLVTSAEKDRIDLIRLEVQECVALILELTTSNLAYIALDAIDELREEYRFVLIEALQRIVDESAGIVKLLLTSRDDVQIEGLLQSATEIRVSPAENRDDIDAFIAAQLGAVVRSRRLLHGHASESLLENIRKSLTTGAGEMFLWVQLQIEVLCRKKTENDIVTELKTGLLGNLDKIYDKTYHSFLALDDSAKLVVQGVFSWILFARRPLTVEALRCAVVMNPCLLDQPSEMKLPALFDVCYNLVVLDSAMNTLRVCHPSVRDYMRRQGMFSEESSNRLLAASCLQQCFKGLTSSPPSFPGLTPVEDFSLYAGLYWPEHLRSAQLADMNVDPTFEPMTRFVFGAGEGSGGSVLSLAFIMWLEWVKQVSENLPRYHKLKRTLETLTSPNGPSPIFAACVFGLRNLLDLALLRMSEVNLEQRSDTGHTPIYLACAFGHNSVVLKLLEHKADANVTCGSYGTPLHVACFRGFVDIVKTLLEHGVSPHSSATFHNAFEAACEGCSEDLAMFLIKEGPVIEDEKDYDIALQKAAEAGFRDVVEHLMKPNVVKAFGRDIGKRGVAQEAILGAIQQGQVAVLRSFLQFHPDMAGKLQRDAMAVAALYGHVDMLVFLHSLGMDMEVEGKFGSALRSASLIGDERAVCKLLEWGADAKASGTRGDCLQAAARKGHVRIMQFLILAKAQVNQKGKPCGTCIQAAAYYGHKEAVKFLLEEGADIYLTGKFEDALHAAVSGGHDEIASFLLERGYRAPDDKPMPGIARGRHRSQRFWYSKDEAADSVDGWQTGFVRESQSPCPEEETDNEHASEDSGQRTDNDVPNKYGLVFAATIGNIPTIRQQLQFPEVDEDEVTEALMAAAAKGKCAATQVLLDNALRHVGDPKRAMDEALVAAAKHGQEKTVQILTDSLNHVVCIEAWAAALKAAAMAGNRSTVATVLTLDRLPFQPCNTDYFAEVWRSERFGSLYRSAKTPPSAVRICGDAIETAGSSGHHEVAILLWDWVLQKGPEAMAADINDWMALSAVAASFADTQTFETCLRLEEKCLNYANKPEKSPGDWLLAAVRGQNIHTFESLFKLIEQEGRHVADIMPSFMEACQCGFNAGALKLADRNNKVALDDDKIAQGMILASISGNESLLIKLLDRLQSQKSYATFISQKLEKALISAAGAGMSGSIQCILDNTDIRHHNNFTTIITRALVTSCRSGHKNVATLCLREGANAEMTVPKSATDVVCSGQDKQILRQRPRPAKLMSYRSLHDMLPHRLPNSLQSNALQASLEGFAQVRDGRSIAGSEYTYPWGKTAEEQQELVVLLMLEHGCDPNDCGGRDQYPLQIAAKWGNNRVVQALLEAGAEVDAFSIGEYDEPVVLAAQRRSAIAFRVVLQILKAGARVPTSADGSLSPAMLQTIDNAKSYLEFPKRDILSKLHHFYTSKETARDLMNSGLRELITIIFNRLPRLVADDRLFGDMLHLAAVAGDLSTVKRLIRHGVDVNHTMLDNSSAIGAAAEFGNLQVMKALIEAGATVQYEAGDVIRMDHKYGIQEPVIKAILGGQASALKLLLDNGADSRLDASSGSLLLFAIQSKSLAVLKSLLQVGVDGTMDGLPLVTAAYNGNLDMVTCLLDGGANANVLAFHGLTIYEQRVCSPLYIACEKGHIEIVRKLLKHGADANLDVGERSGLPLVVAAGHGRLEIVQVLLEKGCSPTERSRGFEAIPSAYQDQFLPMLKHRDFALDFSPVSRGDAVVSAHGVKNVETEPMNSRAKDQVCPNAVSSACDGQNGVHTTLQILDLLLEAIPESGERQSACLEAMQRAAEAQNNSILEFLLRYLPSDSLVLELACRCGSVKAVRKMMDQGVSINTGSTNNRMPLGTAALYMHAELTQFLIANGANLWGSQDESPTLSLYDLAAVVIASYAHSPLAKQKSIIVCEDMVRTCIEAAESAQVEATVNQESLDVSLVLACEVGSFEIASLLLANGAIVDRQVELPMLSPGYCQSALFAAIDGNHPNIIPLLLKGGADPNQIRTIPANDQHDHLSDNSSEWETVAESPTECAVIQTSQTQKDTSPSSFTAEEQSYSPREQALGEMVLQTALEACLGKKSPILLRTFLDCVGTVDISEEGVMLVVQQGTWDRAPGESDLQIFLEHDQSFVVSEEVLVTLLDSDVPVAQGSKLRCFYRFMLERSDCGITTRLLQTVSDLETWRVLHDYYQDHQAVHSLPQAWATARQQRSPLSTATDNHMEEEFRVALERIEKLERAWRPTTVADLRSLRYRTA